MQSTHERNKKKVFVVDDHPLVCEWLGQLINLQADLRFCGAASNVTEALARIQECDPAVVVVDISLEGASGLELLKELKKAAPNAAPIVLSMHEEGLYAERAIRAGARGYVNKREVSKNILQAIRSVLEDKLWFHEKTVMMMAEKLAGGPEAEPATRMDLLSARELEVFRLLGAGRSSKEIAGDMGIECSTVQAFYARLKTKLQLKDSTQLLMAAVRWHDSHQA